MNFNGYIVKNSLIHKMNPSLKFLTVCFFIAMIFIPFGFLFQTIMLVVFLGLYFIAKLPLKRLWNIFQSIIFMSIILIFINWITYKGPGAVFDVESHLTFFKTPSFFNQNNFHTTFLDGKWFIQGTMFGGKWIDSFIFNHEGFTAPIQFTATNGFVKLWEIKDFSNAIIEGKMYSSDALLRELLDSLSLRTDILGKVKYYTSIVNVNGISYLYGYFYSSPWYGFSSEAISLMIFVSTKIFLMILIVTILTSTTSSIQLTCALEDILNPLRVFRLPVTEWSMTIALGLRFIPSLLDESNRIMKAQASRGLDFKNGNIKDKIFSLTSLVVPLFSIAFKKAAELSYAMEARGYNPRKFRTRYREYGIKPFDWILFSFSAIMFGILITLVTITSKPIFIDAYGIHEILSIL